MYNTTYRERPQRTNEPMQLKNGENKMELKECITCGSHNFTDNKCDYCGNKYEVTELYADDKHDVTRYAKREVFYSNEFLITPEPEKQEEVKYTEITFNHGNKRGDKVLSFMLYLLLSIIWFAVTVFIPPLFIITIILLVIYGAYRLTNRNK